MTNAEEGLAEPEVDVGDGPTIDRIVEPPEGDIEIVEDTALPEVLLDHVQENGDDTALRWKQFGVWQEFTWREYYDRVKYFAMGLETLGFDEGDILFTIGYNRPHQLWAWMGAQTLGGMAAPNYEDMLPEAIGNQLELLSPKVAYAEDQEMVDKLLQVADRAPSLEAIVYRDEKGMFRYEDTAVPVMSYEEIEARGKERFDSGEVTNSDLETRIRDVDPHEPAMLPPTSGTTGMPKRVQLSHFNFVNLANAAIEIDPLPEGSDYFSYLPMAWIGEQMILMAAAFLGGWTANFPEEAETESEDLREIGPEIIFSSPGAYESWVADIKAKVENTTRLKRWVYEKAMDIGERYAQYVSGDKRDEEPPATLRFAHWAAYWTAYRPILDKIGLKRAKNVYTGGGPLGEDHFQYYHALGVPLKQIWGQSEVCGFVTMHRDDDIQVETVGEVFPNVRVGITPEGELVVRGPVVTSGYYNQPEKTAEALDGEWLHTDDFGAITDDGHIKVFDRMDDVMELTDGTAVAPISVETKLKFNPYIKEALIVGDGRDSLAAVLNIRFDNVAEWADQRDIQYAGYKDLTQKEPVLELLRGVVADTNERLEGPSIDRFVILFKEFDADDGEMTRTGKIRREIVTNRYDELIEGIYSGEETVEMDVTITYQDGRESRERGEMTVVDLTEPDALVEGEIDG
ncbi:AMP-binding protein [Natronomonas salsuginis]|jgi:long-chain acyl-CoA synthetase|uniref:Long-chain fatty acid--CoA ligase n=1 Tax=Natronomonas salsuginis TaxID=2217661 RepID=A0A4U5JA50_9EURY|nr:AMP-binding protein [Natronomonas salsuginis]TKR26012.1 long-chain fatty acid--CoA ligase [Natronomonas salsuginis]